MVKLGEVCHVCSARTEYNRRTRVLCSYIQLYFMIDMLMDIRLDIRHSGRQVAPFYNRIE